MRRLISIGLAAALALSVAGTTLAAKGGNGNGVGNATPTASSIALNQAGQTLAFGSNVTFTTVAAGLSGNQYPMVYLQCLQGTNVVYGQLDFPSATFVLGGASSPWYSSPGPANCLSQLYAYGGNGAPVLLAATPWFAVGG